MRIFENIVRHLTSVLCMMFAVFLILDQFNPLMTFVDSSISRVLLGVLCVLGITGGALGWREKRREQP